MDYRVIDADGINNVEFDWYLDPGLEFSDGEIEPDLIITWLIYGRVEVIGGEQPAPVFDADPTLEVEDE